MDNQNNPQPQPEQPQIPTQQFFQPSVPPGPAVPPSAAPTPAAPVPEPKKSSKAWIFILVFVLLVAGTAVAVWLMTLNTSKSLTSGKSSSSDSQKDASESELTTTVFSSLLQGKYQVRVAHPAGWQIERTQPAPDDVGNETDYALNRVSIKSAKGNYLHIFDREGVGYMCEDDSEVLTLRKVLTTKMSDVTFREYEAPGQSYFDKTLVAEDRSFGYDDNTALWHSLKEGESVTNSCKIPGHVYYSMIRGDIALLLTKTAEPLDPSAERLGWDDIKDDTEFVAMLQSIEVMNGGGR